MGEDDSGFGVLGHVAAPYQLGLLRISLATETLGLCREVPYSRLLLCGFPRFASAGALDCEDVRRKPLTSSCVLNDLLPNVGVGRQRLRLREPSDGEQGEDGGGEGACHGVRKLHL